MSRTVSMTIDTDNYPKAMAHCSDMIHRGLQGGPVLITFGRPKRNLEQNKKLWACLGDIAKQVEHHGRYYKPEDWKDILSAGFEGAMRFAVNLRGDGMVALGVRTSEYDKQRMSDFLEFIQAFGAERGVEWSDDQNNSR